MKPVPLLVAMWLTLAVMAQGASEVARPDPVPKPFPAHWGAPPDMQTRDYRPLPGGYGHGSSTLASWIQRNLDRDLAAAVTGPARVSGELYAIYLPHGGGTRFDLGDHPGAHEVHWFNPRTGGPPRNGSIPWLWGPGPAWTGFPPAEPAKDWLALIKRLPQTEPPEMAFPRDHWLESAPEEVGVHPSGLRHASVLNAFLRRLGLAVSPLTASLRGDRGSR